MQHMTHFKHFYLCMPFDHIPSQTLPLIPFVFCLFLFCQCWEDWSQDVPWQTGALLLCCNHSLVALWLRVSLGRQLLCYYVMSSSCCCCSCCCCRCCPGCPLAGSSSATMLHPWSYCCFAFNPCHYGCMNEWLAQWVNCHLKLKLLPTSWQQVSVWDVHISQGDA